MALFQRAAEGGLPLLVDVAIDLQTGLPVTAQDKPVLHTGLAALRQWVHFALAEESRRFAWAAHTADYGNELEALRGATQMIEEGRIDYIQLEFGATTLAARVTFHDLWTLLSPKFELYRILKHGLYPIRRYEEVCEVFMYQNLVAIRRK